MFDRVREALEVLRPRLEETAEGYAEVREVDEGSGKVYLLLTGGRLH